MLLELTIASSPEQATRHRGHVPLLIGSLAATAVVVLDQLSKSIVLRELGPGAERGIVTVVPGLLRLIFVRNTGSAFGLFQGTSEILKFIAIVAVVALAGYFARAARESKLIALALGLQVGGALGNLIDRFRHGYVVDWIDLPRWPTFNLADTAITIGVVLLMFGLLFMDQQTTQKRSIERRPADVASVEGTEP